MVVAGAYALGKASVQVTQATAPGLPEKAPDTRTKNVPPPSPVLATLPMPASPDPSWTKCPQDCGYAKFKPCAYKGNLQQDWVGFQGTCWFTFKNPRWDSDTKQRKPCRGDNLFDPPADAPEELQMRCFFPVERQAGDQPNVIKPSQGAGKRP